jgi:hypothetical protein
MSIKEAYIPWVSIITKLSKKMCIFLLAGKGYPKLHKRMIKRGGPPPSNKKTYSFKTGLSKIRNLVHKYKATKTQLPIKVDGAQTSIDKRPIPPKEINSQA